ncbi:MAG TPA: M15 family metallopeptidase [Actinomycetota bacterium]|nr:M15 family metallopeptidase [Actinomycetota bacterium]
MALDSRTRRAARRPSSRARYRLRRLITLLVAAVLVAAGANYFLGQDPVLGNPKAPILLAWTRDDLLPELAEAAREAEGIGAVATARNGVGWLNSWGPDGATRSAPSGFQVPVEVLVVVPQDYSVFVPEEHRSAFQGLAEGGALLGATGATFRGIESTGSLTFGRTTIPVTGVVPDDLVASHEVVLSLDTASRLGIDDLKYVLLELERGTSQEEAEQELRGMLPEGARLGFRAPGEAPVFRPGGTILPQSTIKKQFGEFAGRRGSGRSIVIDPEWVQENTSNFTIPLLGTARCHNKVIPQIRGAFQAVVDEGLSNLVRRRDFGGCLAPRFLNSDPHSGLSHHSWGIAFDFNVASNPYGAEPTMDPRLVSLLEEWGFTWGGRWVVPDGMHFEYLKDAKSGGS